MNQDFEVDVSDYFSLMFKTLEEFMHTVCEGLYMLYPLNATCLDDMLYFPCIAKAHPLAKHWTVPCVMCMVVYYELSIFI